MIGDVIGKPGRIGRRATAAPAARRARHRLRRPPTARTSPAAWASRVVHRTQPVRRRRRRHHERQPHLGQARDLSRAGPRRAHPAPLNYGETGVPGRGWGIFHAADGSEVAVINAQGRTYMQPNREPVHDARPLLDEGADELPPIRLVDFHCELTSEKNAFGRPPRRARQRGRGHAHPRAHGRRADPAARHGLQSATWA